MNKLLLAFCVALLACTPKSRPIVLPLPSDAPNQAQRKQIERQYGMFIHFGINTFHDQEWTDGSKPASSYNPTQIDAEQWVRTAHEAGMRYVIFTAKHHEGFCLWDSRHTEYDVASSPNPTNVVEELAKACKKYGIGLGLYYSLWDRRTNPQVGDQTLDGPYNDYMISQVDELLDVVGRHTKVVEFWFDGAWEKQNYRWPLMELYQTIKAKQPECQVGVNWTIGLPQNADHHPVLPQDQQAGYPIRYFPSDFRLGDPFLPSDNDPKLFAYNGRQYYMPWESTVCISNRWFYHTQDNQFKSVDELERLYRQCTKNDNILILNCPPNRQGQLRPQDIEVLRALRQKIR